MLPRRSKLPRKKRRRRKRKRKRKRKRRRRRRRRRRAESLHLRPLNSHVLLSAPLVNRKSLRLLKALRRVPRRPLMRLLLRPRRLQTIRLRQIKLAVKSHN